MRSEKILELHCGNKYFIIIAIYLPILLSVVPIVTGEEVLASRFISNDTDGALSVTSQKMTLNNQENSILFEGDVVLERDKMTLKAERVEVTFASELDNKHKLIDKADRKKELSKISASGNVNFRQGIRTIQSDSVVYFKKNEKMIFTGSPHVREGENELSGERITIYILEDRVIVDSGKAIIHPR